MVPAEKDTVFIFLSEECLVIKGGRFHLSVRILDDVVCGRLGAILREPDRDDILFIPECTALPGEGPVKVRRDSERIVVHGIRIKPHDPRCVAECIVCAVRSPVMVRAVIDVFIFLRGEHISDIDRRVTDKLHCGIEVTDECVLVLSRGICRKFIPKHRHSRGRDHHIEIHILMVRTENRKILNQPRQKLLIRLYRLFHKIAAVTNVHSADPVLPGDPGCLCPDPDPAGPSRELICSPFLRIFHEAPVQKIRPVKGRNPFQ